MVSANVVSAKQLSMKTDVTQTKVQGKVNNDFDSYFQKGTDKPESGLADSDMRLERSGQDIKKNMEIASSKKKLDTVNEQKDGLENDQSTRVEEITEVIPDELAKQIVQIISSAANVSEKELVSKMQELDMNISDLLNKDSLGNLMAKISGKNSVMELLTDPQLSEMIQNVMGEVVSWKDSLFSEFAIAEGELESLLEPVSTEDLLVELTEAGIAPDKETAVKDNIFEEKTDSPDVAENKVSEVTTGKDDDHKRTQKSDTESLFSEREIADTEEHADESTKSNSGELWSEPRQSAHTSENRVDDNMSGNLMQTTWGQTVAEKLEHSIAQAIPEETADKQKTEIVRQILDSVKANVKEGVTSLEVSLNPENLGKVTIQVASKAGQLTATIAAQTEAAKNAIESQIYELRDTLHMQGAKVEAIEVVIATHNFEENLENGNKQSEQQMKKTRKHVSLEDYMDEPMDTDELMEQQVMEQIGATVSYQA